MQVIAVQLDSVWEDPHVNCRKVDTLLAAAAPEPGALVVLPEMFATGFSLDVSKTCAAPAGGVAPFLSAMARRHGATVVAGVVSPGGSGCARNEAAVFSPEGELIARYVKQRPFSGAGEDAVHARGEAPAFFQWAGLRVAPLICYDLRFPELFRAALRGGAEMFVVIAAWPMKRIEHWVALLRSRAIENQAFVIGVNRTGSEPNFQYCGRSIVVDPHGSVLADAGESECVLSTRIDPSAVRTWRSEFPAVRDFLR
jgi:omega-amidase